MRPLELNLPLNPDYGRGSCVRFVDIEATAGIVRGHLSDNFHEMRCRVTHAEGKIVGIDAQTVRIPTSACPSAVGALQAFVGLPVDAPSRVFYGGGRARDHCTHLLDLVAVAIRHAGLGPGRTLYEAQVPDEIDAAVDLTITRNGAGVHAWQVRKGVIVAPAPLAGRTLDKGFASWATEAFEGDELEAATILARTWLISIGRRYLTFEAAGQPISANGQMEGRCFAYSLPQVASAVFMGEGTSRMPKP